MTSGQGRTSFKTCGIRFDPENAGDSISEFRQTFTDILCSLMILVSLSVKSGVEFM